MDCELTGSFNRLSAPSQLKITDVRFTDVVGAPMHCTLMMIYTNQGIVDGGYIAVPDKPGLGVDDYNDEVLREHLHPAFPELWAPTSQWDHVWSHDRLWS